MAGWLSADMGQHDRALIYFDNGIKAAQEANDRALGAYLLGSVTTLPAFREHSPQATLHVLREETRGFRARRHADYQGVAGFAGGRGERHARGCQRRP